MNEDISTKNEDEMILEIQDLKTYFFGERGVARSVDGVSYAIRKGRTLGVVGESGSGKSVTSLSIMRLIPNPPGEIVGGSIRFCGQELLTLSERKMRGLRGNAISMIFQEPMTSLNPVYTVGDQIMEAILLHTDLDEVAARERAIEMLRKVGIPSPEERIDEYPHQMSGGMKQRVCIAMALVCEPTLLIADEPTTALDVTIQAQILDLLDSLQEEMGMSILFITHDLGVVAEICDDVAVMYAGQVVERASVEDLFEQPAHPYTRALFRSLPDLGPRRDRLEVIQGMVPSPLNFPSGCRFRTRCPFADATCCEPPPTVEISPGHIASCHHVQTVLDETKERTGPYPHGDLVETRHEIVRREIAIARTSSSSTS